MRTSMIHTQPPSPDAIIRGFWSFAQTFAADLELVRLAKQVRLWRATASPLGRIATS